MGQSIRWFVQQPVNQFTLNVFVTKYDPERMGWRDPYHYLAKDGAAQVVWKEAHPDMAIEPFVVIDLRLLHGVNPEDIRQGHYGELSQVMEEVFNSLSNPGGA